MSPTTRNSSQAAVISTAPNAHSQARGYPLQKKVSARVAAACAPAPQKESTTAFFRIARAVKEVLFGTSAKAPDPAKIAAARADWDWITEAALADPSLTYDRLSDIVRADGGAAALSMRCHDLGGYFRTLHAIPTLPPGSEDDPALAAVWARNKAAQARWEDVIDAAASRDLPRTVACLRTHFQELGAVAAKWKEYLYDAGLVGAELLDYDIDPTSGRGGFVHREEFARHEDGKPDTGVDLLLRTLRAEGALPEDPVTAASLRRALALQSYPTAYLRFAHGVAASQEKILAAAFPPLRLPWALREFRARYMASAAYRKAAHKASSPFGLDRASRFEVFLAAARDMRTAMAAVAHGLAGEGIADARREAGDAAWN